MRVLVAGSRDWTRESVIYDALDTHVGPKDVLVHGKCPLGADAYAEHWASGRAILQERHPADWSRGKSAGIARNQEMVDLGADLCLVFVKNGSPGATHCGQAAEKAGIRTIWFKI
jgi:hypothetical protein